MSGNLSNVGDLSTRNVLRDQDARVRRLESQISQVVKNSTNITQHSTLQGLDFASAGHTGFASDSDIASLVTGPGPTVTDQAIPRWNGTGGLTLEEGSFPPSYNDVGQLFALQVVGVNNVVSSTDSTQQVVMTGSRWIARNDASADTLKMFVMREGGTSTSDIFSIKKSGLHDWFDRSTGTADISLGRISAGILGFTNGKLDMGTALISSVLDPVGAQDAATKAYVDAATPTVTWLSLSDTPGAFVADQFVKANAGATALEFLDLFGTANTWSVEQTFTAGIQLNDSDPVNIGTGDDLVLMHDGTNDTITSNIVFADSIDGMRIVWDVDKDSDEAARPWHGLDGEAGGSGTASTILDIGHTKADTTYKSMFGFYPSAQGPVGKQGPAFVVNVDTVTDDNSGFIGFAEDGTVSKLTGLLIKHNHTGLQLFYNSVQTGEFNVDGIVMGGSGSSNAFLSGTSGLPLGVRANFVGSANVGQIKFFIQGTHTAPDVGASSPFVEFVSKVNTTETRCFDVWHANAARSTAGAGIGAGQVFTFDDTISGTLAQGDTYMQYAAGGPTLDFVVDGTTVMQLGTALPNTYTLNATQVPSTTLLASASATTLNNNNVLSQLIQDLQTLGLVG